VTAPIVDARGMRCPWPVLRLARAMRDVDAATLLADDPAAAGEVAALAAAQGWTITEMERGFHVARTAR
jgi:tRNA 2-thiouridine synthesizing protein A